MDKAGRPLTDLKMEDFVVTEDGVKQDVSHFKPVNAPVNVIYASRPEREHEIETQCDGRSRQEIH